MKHIWVYFYFVLFLLVLVHVALYCHTRLYLLFCARHCIFKTIYEIIKQYYICFCQVPMGHEFQDRFDPISVLEIFQITQRSCNHTAIHVRTSLLPLYLYTPHPRLGLNSVAISNHLPRTPPLADPELQHFCALRFLRSCSAVRNTALPFSCF